MYNDRQYHLSYFEKKKKTNLTKLYNKTIISEKYPI